ncbi:amino acid adenylation domain-containing protein [Coleofasciculus sp. FACHB-712]|uniref:non-ribosomal peptide synthetase n=1 Tax=Coleofasciculus sp. FACHB-712 TaxID=2692789 RepID=UPI0016850C13|nr:non-ribosomal peptide synthetase [Coleofasciculus sp. FACHB-712]MBD1945592.1 amino acid adenylation domain-containing protein [Coleofasciculus sp. FACHB-712]
MSNLPENQRNLSPQEKRALLAQLLQEKASKAKSQYPLSYGQQILWLLYQNAPESPAYNVAFTARIRGNVDISALRKAFQMLSDRHPSLRTTFALQNNEPVQEVHGYQEVCFEQIDAATWSADELDRQVFKAYQRPFNLERESVMRVNLFTRSIEEHILLLTIHHIACDGWSIWLILDELRVLYSAAKNGISASLPPLTLTYGDYVRWQNEMLAGADGERLWAYWQKQLAGELPMLNLPTDRPRPPVQTFNGASHPFRLTQELTQQLLQLSQAEGTTLYMTLLAAFQVLLHRYTGQEDILVGSPMTGRTQSEFAPIVGYFMNLLVLRGNLSGNPPFQAFLSQVRQTALGAIAHQDYPFPLLVKQLQPNHDPSRSPLFQVSFILQKPQQLTENIELVTGIETGVVINWDELQLKPFKMPRQEGAFDVTLEMVVGKETLFGEFKYNTDLFNASTIERMQNHFQTLLEGIVANPEQQLSELPLLTKLERQQVLGNLNAATSPVEGKEFNNFRDRSNLTANQFLVWLGQQLYPEALVYNNACSAIIPTQISPEHFQAAFQALVNASDALRTIIEEIDGVPQQRVIANFPYIVEYLDCSEVSEPNELQNWIERRSQMPFDFQKRLFDMVLIKLSEQKYVWYLKFHQIIVDGYAFGLICEYMSSLYECALNNKLQEPFPIPQFQDYINYDKEYQESSRYLKAKAYWEQKLAEPIEPIAFYGQRRLKQTTLVERVACDLGGARTQKLKAIAAYETITGSTNNASLFNIFLGILATYLYRTSGNRQIAIGMPLHNRRSKSFKKTIGSFAQEVPLRIEIEANDTVLSLINRISITTSEAIKYGQYVLENSIRNPIYDVLLNYELQVSSDFQGVKITSESVHSGHRTESLAVRIRDWDLSGNLVLDFDFHKDVFDEELQILAIQHFLQVLDSFLVDKNQLISQINLLSDDQKQYFLTKFVQNPATFTIEKTISQKFEAQVQKTPDRIAVVLKDQFLTYAQLNAKANQLARYLQSLGVKPEVLVGLCAERSIEMIVGLLGILKAGGAYVPLDPVYPKERLGYMLSDSQVQVLLTQQKLIPLLHENKAQIICLDTHWEKLSQESEENLLSLAKPKNLAYVIYTSGSTGKPKGVAIEHCSLVNFTQSAISEYGLTPSDSILQFASISFDTAAEEIYPCLASGATLVLRTDEMLNSAATFLKICQDLKLTVLDLPTAYWHQIVSELETTNIALPESLRLVIIGGERAIPELVRIWQKRVGDYPKLVNTYGPTEATVVATTYPITASATIQQQVPIGRAIANVQTYILDRNLQPVAIGIPGELHIGGIGLARGYLNDSKLTQDKFISNPFGNEQNAHLYKTGDLVRYLPDSNIEFLGRIDEQIKIRGFRVETGEIEAALSEYPQLKSVAVIAKEDKSGNHRLAAYIVSKEKNITEKELRKFLQQKLPDYMIPSVFTNLDTLPLTANGKVDRRTLSELEIQTNVPTQFVAPRTPTEEKLAQIWAEVLGVERVGVQDNFFELGGHSLMATKILARIRQTFSVELPIRSLFEAITIAELSDRIETIQWLKSTPVSSAQSELEEGEL